ncbi:hypothetical protein M758_UG153900 [Ceratodon purpureus]|nr:hypothetical protein M758_UG153900 [Ceratodon purpureus]
MEMRREGTTLEEEASNEDGGDGTDGAEVVEGFAVVDVANDVNINGLQRSTNSGSNWDGCPMSPGPGFPDAAQRIGYDTMEEEYETYDTANKVSAGALENTTPNAGGNRIALLPTPTARNEAEIIAISSPIKGDIFGTIHDELEGQAAVDRFFKFSRDRKFAYLIEREMEFAESSSKRRTEDNACARWIADKL